MSGEDTAGKRGRGSIRIDKIVETTNGMINPFEHEKEELLHITSGTVATEEVEKIYSLPDREPAFIAICKERLQRHKHKETEAEDVYQYVQKLQRVKYIKKEVSLKADRNLLARLVVFGRIRKLDLIDRY